MPFMSCAAVSPSSPMSDTAPIAKEFDFAMKKLHAHNWEPPPVTCRRWLSVVISCGAVRFFNVTSKWVGSPPRYHSMDQRKWLIDLFVNIHTDAAGGGYAALTRRAIDVCDLKWLNGDRLWQLLVANWFSSMSSLYVHQSHFVRRHSSTHAMS